MKYWWIIDDMSQSRALVDICKIPVSTEAEAIVYAQHLWERLSPHDRRDRQSYEVVYAPALIDDDEIADLDQCEVIRSFC